MKKYGVELVGVIVALFFCTAFIPPFKSNALKNKISGHWITDTFMGRYEAGDKTGIGDTIRFSKTKYNAKYYHWAGGASSGLEFKGDSGFVQYQNVLCSDETDTKIGYDKKYFFVSDSIVEVKSSLRCFRFKILQLGSKKLQIKIMGPL